MIKLSPFKDLHKLIDTANNGHDCLMKIKVAQANNISYSLIFMDLSMPIMDGYEATM
jgi:CheY-like chemotaxis protein